jgi:hypothetical protein
MAAHDLLSGGPGDLGNAMGHPSFRDVGTFTNQTLAQIELFAGNSGGKYDKKSMCCRSRWMKVAAAPPNRRQADKAASRPGAILSRRQPEGPLKPEAAIASNENIAIPHISPCPALCQASTPLESMSQAVDGRDPARL